MTKKTVYSHPEGEGLQPVARRILIGCLMGAILASGCSGKQPRDPNRIYIDEVKYLEKGELEYVGVFTTHPLQNYAVTKTDDRSTILVTADAVDATQVRFPKRFKSKVIKSFSAKNTAIEGKTYGQLFLNLKQDADFTARQTEYGLRLDLRPIQEEIPQETPEKTKEAAPTDVEKDLAEVERTEEKDKTVFEEDLKELEKGPEETIPETQAETPALEPVLGAEGGKLEKIMRDQSRDREKLTLISSIPVSFEKTIFDREIILEFKETELGEEIAPLDINDEESYLSKITATTTDAPYKSAKISIQFNDTVSPMINQNANEIYVEFEKKKPPKFLEVVTEEEVTDFGRYLTSPSRLPGKELSLHAKDTPIEDLLQMLSEASDYNIVIGKGISGSVNLRLLRVPWDEALIAILEAHQLGFVKQGNILRVASLDGLRKEKEKARAALLAKDRLMPVKILFFPVRYRKASELKQHLYPLLSDRGSISIDRSSNTIIMSDIPSVLDRAKSFIASLDTK
ncbi:MAG: secretin N-terminal domain-containing protein [Deltaproteobacteria bacterium]